MVIAAFAALGLSMAAAVLSADRDMLVAAAMFYLIGNVIHLIYVVVSRHCHALSLVQALFFTIFFAAPALVQLSLDQFPWRVVHQSADLQRGMLVMVGGQMLVWAGFHMWGPRKGKAPPMLPIDRSLGFQSLMVWGGLIVIFACMPLLGFNTLFGSRTAISELANEDTTLGQIVFICRSISISLFAVAIIQWRNRSPAPRGLNALLLVGLSLLALIIYNNPIASPRYQFLAMVIAVSALFVDMSKPWIKGLITALSLLFVFFFFPVLKLISLGRYADGNTGIFSRDTLNYITSVDFDPYFWIVNTLIYLENNSIRWGESLLGALLFFVPRGIWEGKPIDSGTLVSEGLGYVYTSVSNPLQAEAMMAFGLPGLIAICFLFGRLVRYVEIVGTQWKVHGEFGNQMTVIYAFLSGFLPIILRGALNANAPQFGSGLMFMAIFFIVTQVSLASAPDTHATLRKGLPAR